MSADRLTDASNKLDNALQRYWDASMEVSKLSLELITAVAAELAPTATVVVLDDSDQEGSEFVFVGFEDAQGDTVEYDEDVVHNLIWGPVSNLRESDASDYRIDVTD